MRLTTEFAELAPVSRYHVHFVQQEAGLEGLTLRAGSSLAVGYASPTARRDELKVRVMPGNGVAVAEQPGLLRCALSPVSQRNSAVE